MTNYDDAKAALSAANTAVDGLNTELAGARSSLLSCQGTLAEVVDERDRLLAENKDLKAQLAVCEGGGTPQTATLWGANDSNAANSQLLVDANGGSMPVVRLFEQNYGVALIDNSSVKHALTLKPKALIVSGKNNDIAFLTGWLDAGRKALAALGIELHWVYWHEPEDDIEKGTMTSATFRANTVRHSQMCKNLGIPYGLIIMGYTLNPASGRNWQDYFTAGIFTWVGADQYNAGNKASPPKLYPAEGMFDDCVAWANQCGLPLVIAEAGIIDVFPTADRVAWFKDMHAYLDGKAIMVTYFNKQSNDGKVNYSIKTPAEATGYMKG